MDQKDHTVSLETNVLFERTFYTSMAYRFGSALLRHRWVILGTVLAASLVAGLLSWLLPPPYKAESWLLVKTAPSQTDDTTDPLPHSQQIDAMSNLVFSYAIEERVRARPELAHLPKASLLPGELIRFIEVGGSGVTKVIEIAASQPNPTDATLLSNIWSEEAILFLNNNYVSDVASLTRQQEELKGKYEQAQKEYESFLSTTRITELTARLDALGKGLGNYIETLGSNEATIYIQQLQANQKDLTNQYTLRDKLQDSISTARTISTTISSSPGFAPDDSLALASLLLTTSSLIGAENIPVQLQVSGEGLTSPASSKTAQIEQIERLISVLEERLGVVLGEIDRLSQSILETKPYTVTASLQPLVDVYIQRHHELNTELEAANATNRDLIGKRDLYWSLYNDVSKRLVDVTSGPASLNKVEQVVTANEDITRRAGGRLSALVRSVTSALVSSLFIIVLAILVYELMAPGRQLVRELVALRPRRRRAALSE